MTKAEIKKTMVGIIRGSFDPTIEDEIAELIKEEDITEFLWSKDWGKEIFEEYMKENCNDFKNELLEDIYNEIEIEGLDW